MTGMLAWLAYAPRCGRTTRWYPVAPLDEGSKEW